MQHTSDSITASVNYECSILKHLAICAIILVDYYNQQKLQSFGVTLE